MIYYAEDDRGIRELLLYTLRSSGFEAEGFEDGESLLDAVRVKTPNLILLDIMLPVTDGLEALRRLRANPSTRKIPVIMITAMDSEYDKVTGLDCGADDYISKPFGMMETISRIKAVLRRFDGGESAENIYKAGGVALDENAHTVTSNGETIPLTLKEFELLKLLMKNAGRVMTRDQLLESVWGYDFDGETRTVDVHIRTLRSKLGEGGVIIDTVRGVGYTVKAGS